MNHINKHAGLIHAALDDFNYFYGEPYEPEFSSMMFNSLERFAETAVGETINRIDPYLMAMGEIAEKEGRCTAGDLTVRKGSKDKDDPHALSFVLYDADDSPVFRIDRSTDQSKAGKPRVDTYIYEIDPAKPDYEYPKRIASNVWAKLSDDRPPFSRGRCQIHNFEKFVRASQLLRNALAFDATTVVPPQPTKSFTEEVIELLEADGGVAGPLALQVAFVMQQRTAVKVLEWAKTAIVELDAEQKKRGLVWGQSYLLYNDLDISSCSLPMKNPKRIGVFNQNVSLMSDDFGHVATVDLDDDGKPTGLRLTAVNRYENVSEVVESIIEGRDIKDIAFGYFDSSDELARFTTARGTIEEKGMLEQFAFYLHVDHKVVVGGEMDGERADDCEVKTDFDKFREDSEADLDSEENAADSSLGR